MSIALVPCNQRPTLTLQDSTIPYRDEGEEDASGNLSHPDAIGRFIVQGVLGAGGMGLVLEAYDEALERRVAIKVLHAEAVGGYDRRQSLRREARALAGLSHPNVVQVFEVGEHEGQLYVAMELVEGLTLKEWLDVEERGFEPVRDMLCEAGRGLEAAHARGLLHRDFKPENVLVGDGGRPRVVDFGLVSRLPETENLTKTPVSLGPTTVGGKQAGTVPFMAPEQLMGWPLDARADQFAFCVAVYEAVYGRHPFDAPGIMEIGLRIISGDMDEPPLRPDVPRWLPGVLMRGMSMRPKDRFADMNALLAALQPVTSKRAKPSSVLVGSAVLVMAAGVLSTFAAPVVSDVCGGHARSLAEVWGSERHVAVQQAFGASGVEYSEDTWLRVRDHLDLYASRWRRADREVCEASREATMGGQSVVVAQARCLDARLRELQQLVDALEQSDEQVIARAVTAVTGLGDIDECRNPSSSSKGDEEWRHSSNKDAAVAVVRARLDEAKIERELGHSARALELLDGVVEQAEAVGHPLLVVEAMVAIGGAQVGTDALVEAEQTLADAFWLAQSTGASELAVDAGTLLIHIVGDRQMRFEDGMAWVRHTEALLEREPMDDHRRAWALNNRGTVLLRHGHLAEAREVLLEALLFEGVREQDKASFCVNLGSVYLSGENAAEAEPYYLRAISLRERALGTSHPSLGSALINLANLHLDAGKPELARPLLERAIGLGETPGHGRATMGAALLLLGSAVGEMGEQELALEHMERARDLFNEVHGPNHPRLGLTLGFIADLHHEATRWEEAERDYQRAVDILQPVVGAEHPNVKAFTEKLREVQRARGGGALAAVGPQ